MPRRFKRKTRKPDPESLPPPPEAREVQCIGVGALERPHTFRTIDTTGATRICEECRKLVVHQNAGRVALTNKVVMDRR